MIDPEAIDMTERAVLFAATQSEAMRLALISAADVKWFLGDDHRKLYNAIRSCVEKQSQVDSLAILRSARSNASATFGDVVLSADWLAQGRAEVKGMTIESFTEEHIPVLREAFQARELHRFFADGMEKIISQNPTDVLSWAGDQLHKVGNVGTTSNAVRIAKALLDEYERPFEDAAETARKGPLTCLPWLDSIGFRLRPGEHTTLAGKPGHGKTIVSTQFAIGASTQCGVAVIPAEDGHEAWIDRYAKMTHGFAIDDIRAKHADHRVHSDFTGYCQQIKDRPLYVATNAIGITTFGIVTLLQQLKARDESLSVCIIDQVFKIGDYDKREHKGETQTNAITRTVNRLIDAANKLRIHLVMLQHVAKDVVGDPQIKDISDSYIFERASRRVILVNRPNYGDANLDNTAKIDIAKWTMGQMQSETLPFQGSRFQIGGFVDPALRLPMQSRTIPLHGDKHAA
jgi:replicative DNA helicase